MEVSRFDIDFGGSDISFVLSPFAFVYVILLFPFDNMMAAVAYST
jgi:hypothetical protein